MKDKKRKAIKLSDMINWWKKDGGNFNEKLYIKVLKEKHK